MKLFFITLLFFATFIFAMAIGVIFGKRRLKGSCGGLGGCAICGSDGEEKQVDNPGCQKLDQV